MENLHLKNKSRDSRIFGSNGTGPGKEDRPLERLSPEEIKKFFEEETVFRGATDRALERLSRIAVETTISKGEMPFSAGQPCNSLYFIIHGCGYLVKTAADGRERILHHAIPGDMMGAVPFFDRKEYPVSFVAVTDCTLLGLPRGRLLDLLGSDSTVAMCIIGGIVARLRKMTSIIEEMSFIDITHRLWKYLMEGSKRTGSHDYPRVFELLPTRDLIAHAIGTVREVVSRRLSHLVETGHIKLERRRLVLLKPLRE